MPRSGLTIVTVVAWVAMCGLAQSAWADDSAARVSSVKYQTFIYPRPDARGRVLGIMRVGFSVALKDERLVAGQNCPGGFFAIEPRGYVCRDRTVTLEQDTPFLRNNAITMPRAGDHPYDYALSSGAPMYARLPTRAEARRAEGRYGAAGVHVPLAAMSRNHERLATVEPIAPEHPVPGFLALGLTAKEEPPLSLLVRTIPHGSMLSYARAFEADGRTWLLAADLTVVPADRVRRFVRSASPGVLLGGDVTLPLGWFRGSPKPAYRMRDDATFERSGDEWAPSSYVALSGTRAVSGARSFHETRELRGGVALWLDASDASIVDRAAARPFGVAEGETWIAVSISRGTLVAYDDLVPVFSTLVSPGKGGISRAGGDNVRDATTPLGRYRITFKDRANTMSSDTRADRNFIADVPFTQYFAAPFALHGAYWHDRLGEAVSAGCVNAALGDARWLFEWSEPKLPEGWHGVAGAGAPENGAATWVVITR
ncbi:MAG: hypothetical protein EXR75_07025 [Myxococcales bacterium]|nr:hypothetical protein [Myxococcales bacterium]